MSSPGSNRQVYKAIRNRILVENDRRRIKGLLPYTQDQIQDRVRVLYGLKKYSWAQLNIEDLVDALSWDRLLQN